MIYFTMFKKHNEPTSSSFANPIIVEDQMRGIEMTFKLLTCFNTQNVICAYHMLRKSVIH